MTEAQCLEIIHKSVHKANADIMNWTAGGFLSDMAAEGFMVSYIMQGIMRSENPPSYVLLEASTQYLKEISEKKPKGRPPYRTSGQSRVDMVVLNRDWKLKYAIEAKCAYLWQDTYIKDVDRLAYLQSKYSKKNVETAMQAGIFVAFVHSYSSQGKKAAKEKMEAKLNDWHEQLCGCQDRYSDIKIYCHRSSLPYNVYEDGDEVHLATSICAVVKSA